MGDGRGGVGHSQQAGGPAVGVDHKGTLPIAHGTTDLGSVLRSDFDSTTIEARFSDNYAAAGRGLPIAVVDDTGHLIGELEPREIMEEMGRVEQLVDGFEREVFL